MEKNKVYTKTGDDGTTGLFSGKRVPKHHTRIKAYGTIDELIAWFGLIRDHVSEDTLKKRLFTIQDQLMRVATLLAIDSKDTVPEGIDTINHEDIFFIENEIDTITESLPPLKNFIIPGGHPLISYTHLARCVCRRAERFITALDQNEPIDPNLIAYTNRLSDYLFTLSRKFSDDLGISEVKWNENQ